MCGFGKDGLWVGAEGVGSWGSGSVSRRSLNAMPMSSELGTDKTAGTRFWSWVSGESP